MTDKEPAADTKEIGEMLDELRFSRAVEIDHHVSAEDGVKRSAYRPLFHQVQTAKGDQGADVAVDRDGIAIV